nr:helix-turn-helix domain-containing protein [Pandoraea sp. XY-2]
MGDKNHCDEPCPIARSLGVAGDAWSILILRDAHAGLTRFDQFRKSLGIAPTMLTRRLATLTEEGLLEKRRYSEHPPREEYLLTAAGRDFLPVLFMIGAWGGNTVATASWFASSMQKRELRSGRWRSTRLREQRSGLVRYALSTRAKIDATMIVPRRVASLRK